MFGHVLGLGDRHCENILFLETNGRIVHVDFSCLFERGQLLEIPERVPFRLTQNLVDALSPLGWKGNFFHSCCSSLKMLKNSKMLLLSNLESLIHDPISDVKKTQGEPNAVLHIIQNKLNGIEGNSLFRSDISQVAFLIESATCPENLAFMYVGWAPFL